MGKAGIEGLKERELLYRRILDSATDFAIISMDKRRLVKTWNSGAEKLIGYPAREIVGKSADLIFGPEDIKRGAPKKEMLTAARTGKAEDERWHMRKDGSRFWGSGLMMPLRDSDRSLTGYIKILRDRTRQRIAEATGHQFRMLVDSLEDYAMFMLDPSGIIVHWNAGARNVHGYSADQIIGRHFRVLFTRQDQRRKTPEREMRAARTQDKHETEGWRVRKGGQKFLAHVTTTCLRNDQGRIVAYGQISRDVTERQRLNEALHQVNQSLEQRVHERTEALHQREAQLRRLATELTRAQRLERERIAEDLHAHLAQLLTMCEIRTGLLREQSTSTTMDKALTDLSNYLQEAMQYTRTLMSDLSPPVLHRRNLSHIIEWLAMEVERRGLRVKINDDGKTKNAGAEVVDVVFQGVREILFNVLKHSGSNQAYITVRKDGQRAALTITDQGKGSRPTKKLAGPSTSRGFGLWKLREKLLLVEGELEMDFKPGQGTSATIIVPLLRRRSRNNKL